MLVRPTRADDRQVTAAAAALRNLAINLHHELDDTGVQAAHVTIDVSIGTASIPAITTGPATQIAPVCWDLPATS